MIRQHPPQLDKKPLSVGSLSLSCPRQPNSKPSRVSSTKPVNSPVRAYPKYTLKYNVLFKYIQQGKKSNFCTRIRHGKDVSLRS